MKESCRRRRRLNPAHECLEPWPACCHPRATPVTCKLRERSWQGLQLVLLLEALLLSAALIYAALYWLVMPLRVHDKPLYFDYSKDELVRDPCVQPAL